jgi:hypothetical protein
MLRAKERPMGKEDQDAECVARVVAGDLSGFEAIVQRWQHSYVHILVSEHNIALPCGVLMAGKQRRRSSVTQLPRYSIPSGIRRPRSRKRRYTGTGSPLRNVSMTM